MLPRIAYYTALALRNSTLTPGELRELQDRKVRRLVRYCYDYVPYYRGMFRGIGLTPDDVRGTADLRLIPVTRRRDIVENYPNRITVRGARVGALQLTSGTTGRPLSIGLGVRQCDVRVAQSMRRAFRMRVMPWEKVATIETTMGASGGSRIRTGKGSAGIVSQVLVGSFNIAYPTLRQLRLGLGNSNFDDVCGALLRFKPDVLSSRPSHARRLSRSLKERGTPVSPRLVIGGGEFLSKAMRNDLRDYLGTDVYDSYGAREIGGVGIECQMHDGIHVNADNYVHEVVRDGRAVDPGESGDILVTALENEATPLLRYEIGDVVVQGEMARCSCGSSFPRIQAILGRSNDGLVAADGSMIPPGVICDELESVLGLRDFQVLQKGVGFIVVRVRGPDNNPETRQKLGESLGQALAGPQTIDLETWGDADIPAKYRPVMSRLPPR